MLPPILHEYMQSNSAAARDFISLVDQRRNQP
jgi:hypothetical protein